MLECKSGNVTHICNSEYKDHPVTNINLSDAEIFCNWLDRRLPLEMEWEMAAYSIDPVILLKEINKKFVEVESESLEKTENNIYGLYSNVSEWTLSEYSSNEFYSKKFWSKKNPIQSVTIKGSSIDFSELKEYYFRVDRDSSLSYSDVGFRCASSLMPEEVISKIAL